jgi:hypothetical protein
MCRHSSSETGDVQAPGTQPTTINTKTDDENNIDMSSDRDNEGHRTTLDSFSLPMQFALLGSGVFFFFGIHNILQEAMMKVPGFNFGVMLGYMEVIG